MMDYLNLSIVNSGTRDEKKDPETEKKIEKT
jgi:hypothetical protein